MLTTINEADLSAVIALRKKYKETFLEKFGVRLGYMSFFTRAVCKALEEFPVVNARLEENQIVYHDYADISIAISSPRGLVVPVIRNAESKSLAQIEKDISVYSQKAKEGNFSMQIESNSWGDIESSLGNYDWSGLDYSTTKAEQQGFQYSLIIEVIHTTALGEFPQEFLGHGRGGGKKNQRWIGNLSIRCR